MAKIDMSKFQKKMDQAIEEIKKPQTMKLIGEFARDRIVKRTRLGGGVTESGEAQRLLKLSESYKKQRKRLNKKGDLAQLTSPSKSNLTLTGQMLDNVSVKSKTGSASIEVTGIRKKSILSNKDVAGYVSEKRPFLNISKAEMNGLNRFIRELIEKMFKK